MNLAEAKLKNLEVVAMVPPNREDLCKIVVEACENVGREVILFTDEFQGQQLLCVVALPRKNHGMTSKTVREAEMLKR